ncbi:MAG TPA: phosphoribosyltransferase family protein [Chloroflexota bacterium]
MDGLFEDRLDAGRRLAERLAEYRDSEAHVLGLARGGVVVGYAVAETLHLPLHALVVRKLGAPFNPELAIGAVSETRAFWLDEGVVAATGATHEYIQHEIAQQVAEARRQQQAYAVGPPLETVRGKTAIVVDDGIATGSSALVGAMSAHDLGASGVIVAAPVASRQAVEMLRQSASRVIALVQPDPFWAVGIYYRNFDQVTDAEVIDCLKRANSRQKAPR